MSVNEKMTAIADAIRGSTGGSEPLTLDAMAQEIPNVYNAGYEKGKVEGGGNGYYDTFWDTFQSNGSRTDYRSAFSDYWCSEIFYPKYDFKPTGSQGETMFRYFGKKSTGLFNLKERLAECDVKLDVSGCSSLNSMFDQAQISDVGILDFSSCGTLNYIFSNSKIVNIEKMIVVETTKYSNTFANCTELLEVRFDGVIGQNGLNLTTSRKLSYESLMSIINNLKDYSEDTSGTVWKVTLGSYNLEKLSDTELNMIEEKGWTYA